MPDAFWAVARAQAQREAFAAEHLETRGFEVFLPLVETRRSVDVLLRGYCFVRIIDRWRSVETTFGVLAFIRFGDTPAKVPDAEIAALRARVDSIGAIRLPPPPPPARGGKPARRRSPPSFVHRSGPCHYEFNVAG